MMRVVLANGESIAFPDGADFEIDETGRLRVSVDESEIAIFAHRGWMCIGRSTPKMEADETPGDSNRTIISDDLDDEDDF